MPAMQRVKIFRILKNKTPARGNALALLLFLAMACLLGLAVIGKAGAPTDVLPQQVKPDPRFDNLVRGDMFAGMAGDAAAFSRAMKLCEDMLAKNPKHPEALVWHGSGDYFLAGRAFQTGDFATGMELFNKSLKEMDDAVSFLPDSITVLIPRGAVLLEGSKHVPVAMQGQAQLGKALADYEKVLAAQKDDWAKLPLHSRGELLSGLAEGWYRAGNAAKARSYMQRIIAETTGSEYAARAQAVLVTANPPKQLNWRCIGCHVAP
jgi:tetratricopeptide (TPR) repeat protein